MAKSKSTAATLAVDRDQLSRARNATERAELVLGAIVSAAAAYVPEGNADGLIYLIGYAAERGLDEAETASGILRKVGGDD